MSKLRQTWKKILVINKFTILNNKLVIDVGCGWSDSLRLFYDLGCRVIGIEIQNKYIEEQLKNLHTRKEIHLVLSDGSHSPVKRKVADLVWISDVLEHVEQDHMIVKEAYRVLKENGLVFISVPNKFQIVEHHLLFPFGGILPSKCFKALAKKRSTWLLRTYSQKELLHLTNPFFERLHLCYQWPEFELKLSSIPSLATALQRISMWFQGSPLNKLGSNIIYVGKKRTNNNNL